MGGYPVLKGASYVLAVVPDMVLENGTTQTTEKIVNPDSAPDNNFKDKLKTLLAAYPNIDTAAMGFPSGWESEDIWK